MQHKHLKMHHGTSSIPPKSSWRSSKNLRLIFFILLSIVLVEFLISIPLRCSRLSLFYSLCLKKQKSTASDSKVDLERTLVEDKFSGNNSSSLCPVLPPGLDRSFEVDLETLSWDEMEFQYHFLKDGGLYIPPTCVARHKVAIIVPFRDRESHLKIFLNNIHPFLQLQQLEYAIYIVDLFPGPRFNRAMLMNIGFVEALQDHNFQCVVFHDVDLIPEMGLNLYSCPDNPRHMSVAVDKFNYKLPYDEIFGGVTSMTVQQFKAVNGYSNKFFGWGGEDDDMFNRIKVNNMTVIRYSHAIARYKMLSHKQDEENPKRFTLLQSGTSRWKKDGINSLKYKRLKLEKRRLYTYVLAEIDEQLTMSENHGENVINQTEINHPSSYSNLEKQQDVDMETETKN